MENDTAEVQEVTVAVNGFYGGGDDEEVLITEDGSGKKNADRVKGPWSPEEDAILSRLVSNFGARNWSLIARGIPGRSGKSCRLRWCNQLDPAVKRKPFTGQQNSENKVLTTVESSDDLKIRRLCVRFTSGSISWIISGPFWKMIWRTKAPFKAPCFGWLAAWDACFTQIICRGDDVPCAADVIFVTGSWKQLSICFFIVVSQDNAGNCF
ncbi:hypothetical protein FXO37_15547 [Capsicum annuum]|nr:hypothetical protein FXO37_15547 [Capsicum annuum]